MPEKKPNYSEVSKEKNNLQEEMKKNRKEYDPHALDNADPDIKAELAKKWIKKAGLDEKKVLASLGLPANASNKEIVDRVKEFQAGRTKDGLGSDGILGPKTLALLDKETGDDGDFSKTKLAEIKNKTWKEAQERELEQEKGKLSTAQEELAELEKQKRKIEDLEGEDKEEADTDLVTEKYTLKELQGSLGTAQSELKTLEDKFSKLDISSAKDNTDPMIAEYKNMRDIKIPEKKKEIASLQTKIAENEDRIDKITPARNKAVMEIVQKYAPQHQEVEQKIAAVQGKISETEEHIAQLQKTNEGGQMVASNG